jgi:2-polyprenyl-3-methyl-5-hydroxy-6-metoxy-1,4-benzoquinol methylase
MIGAMRIRYVQPSIALLKDISIERNQDISLDVYCSDQTLLRWLFWFRLQLMTWLIRRVRPRSGDCLDFGGGSGIFTASLATGFERVTLIDRNTQEAAELKARLGLTNVELVNADIATFDFGADRFDAITATDVLEHFADLDLPLPRIKRWLKRDGYLFTSLPTENVWYRWLRIVFNKTKPPDHYHSAAEVERALHAAGFRKVAGLYHPLLVPVLPLFRISAWRKG